jgi:ribose transport system permease protein
LLLVLLALMLGISLFKPVFLTVDNLLNLVSQVSILATVCVGMTFVIISGGIDISVGSSVAFSGAVGAYFLNLSGSAGIGMASAILLSAVLGAANGTMIGKFRMSPFIATLATMVLARGLALYFTDAKSVPVSNAVFVWLGQSSVGPVPAVLLLIVAVYLLANLLLNRTVFGRDTFAIGGNISAATASGRRVNRTIFFVYSFAGAMAGIGSIITVGRLSSAQPWAGLGLEFDVITAVVLGGTSLSGGEGSIRGTLLGALIFAVIANGLDLLNVGPFYTNVFRGVVLLVVVLIDRLSRDLRARVASGAVVHQDNKEAGATGK